MNSIKAAIIVGSDSDLPVINETVNILEQFGIAYSIAIASAHRTPAKVRKFVADSEKNGADVFIAAAGMAAALPGVVASETTKPVIGVPMQSKTLSGVDALLSIVQMPSGVPVGTVAIGKAGAKNAGILAAQILSIKYPNLKVKLQQYKKKMADAVMEKDSKLQKLGIEKYLK